MSAFTPVKRGSDEPILTRTVYSYNRNTGGQTAQTFKGISIPKMETKFTTNRFLVQTAELTEDAGVAELRLIWAGDPSGGGGGGSTNAVSLTIDRWETPEPKSEKPRFNHPTVYYWLYSMAGFSSAGASDDTVATYVSRLNLGVANNTKLLDLFTQANFDGILAWSMANPVGWGIIKRAYQAVLQGQTHYQISQYALRHTTNAPSYWSRNVADNNVNCIYTHSQLIAESSDSGLWFFPIPGRLQYKLAAAYADYVSKTPARAAYQIGWLKSASAEASTGRSRTEIQTGFVLDQWPTDVYNLAT